jgi:2-(1,2-epoxy-1,2-dihydrophenyl)acetyl-CoA isomerase
VTDVLVTEANDDVLTLTLNRPDSYNAIDPELRDALVDTLSGPPMESARCIIIRGSGRGFCAGIDLKSSSAGITGYELVDYMRSSTQAIVRAVVTCPRPIVSCVHGVCAGVALVLALGADHCVAADNARFSAPFLKRALIPDGASIYLLPRLVGLAQARRMLLFGEDVGAVEALASGMIGEVAPAASLSDVAGERAAQLVALPPAALGYTKAMLLRTFELDFETALFEERAGQALMSTTADYAEGVAAFRDRRPPRFGHGVSD